MFLCQCYIFCVLCGIFTSFKLTHSNIGNPSTDIEIRSRASPSGGLGQELSRNVQLGSELAERARRPSAEAKADNGFKGEIQVPINIYKPSSLSKENGGAIERPKRKAQQNSQKATKKVAKKREVSNVPIILGSSITSLILVLACVCICLRCGKVDNEDEEAFENETKEMRSFQRRRGRY